MRIERMRKGERSMKEEELRKRGAEDLQKSIDEIQNKETF